MTMRSRYDRLVLRRIALRAGFVLSPEYHVGRGSLSSEPWNKCGRLSKTKERIRFIPFFEAFLCPFLLGWHTLDFAHDFVARFSLCQYQKNLLCAFFAEYRIHFPMPEFFPCFDRFGTPADACTLFVISGRSYFIVFAFFTVLFYRQMLVCQVGKQTKVNIVINRLVGKYSLKAIEQGIFTPSTKQRLDELEARKEEILVNIQTAELQKLKLTREQMTAWFEQFRHGDPANRDFQKRLIDTFVNAVYVFDDKLVLTYNYQHVTRTISLDEIASALSSDFDGATPPQLTQTNTLVPKRGCFVYTFQLNKKMIRKCRLFYLLRNRKNLRIRARQKNTAAKRFEKPFSCCAFFICRYSSIRVMVILSS